MHKSEPLATDPPVVTDSDDGQNIILTNHISYTKLCIGDDLEAAKRPPIAI
jgi:hypothetical protein